MERRQQAFVMRRDTQCPSLKWIAASRYKKPELETDVMSETSLRYQGAEADEIDWHPMETIPADRFSLLSAHGEGTRVRK